MTTFETPYGTVDAPSLEAAQKYIANQKSKDVSPAMSPGGGDGATGSATAGGGTGAKKDPPSRMQALWHGLLRGGRDVLEGGAQIGARMGPDEGGAAFTKPEDTEALKQRVDQAVRQSAQQYEQDPARRAFPMTAGAGRIGGNIAATAPIAAFPGMQAGATPSMAGLIGRGIAGGAMGGALSPVQNTQDYWTEKAKQIGAGGAAGGVLPGLGSAAGRLPGAANVGRAFRPLRDFVTGTEERTNNGFARSIARQVLDPIGKSNSVTRSMSGHALNDHVESALSQAYDAIKPKLQLSRGGAINAATQDTKNLVSELAPDEGRQYEKIIENRLLSKIPTDGSPLTGQAFKNIESDLGSRAQKFLNTNKDDLGQALLSTVHDLRATLAKENPQFAGELQRINEGWKMWVRMRQAASRGATRYGTFGPSDMLNAIRSLDPSAGRSAFAKGDALLQKYAEIGHHAVERRGTSNELWNMLGAHGLPLQIAGATARPIGRGLQRVGGITGAPIGETVGRKIGDRGPAGGTVTNTYSYKKPPDQMP